MKEEMYKLEQSPLYKLSNKSKLAKLLGVSKKDLLKLAKYQPYNSFPIQTGDKIREVDTPKWKLKSIQSRMKDLLARIETPDWLFSGKKGCSYIDNARFHQKSKYAITCDIESFYPNCSRERIFQIFKYTFKMTDDVAWVVADLLSYRSKVPTGSPSSQIIAFWAYYPTFNRINKLVESYNAKISLYVDDIAISSEVPIPIEIVAKIKTELESVGHTLKLSKTKVYGKKDYKLVTGVAISPDGNLTIPNKRRKKLVESVISGASEASIIGQIRSGQVIDKTFESIRLEKILKK